MKKLKCINCGGTLTLDKVNNKAVCPYCDSAFILSSINKKKPTQTSTSKTDHSNVTALRAFLLLIALLILVLHGVISFFSGTSYLSPEPLKALHRAKQYIKENPYSYEGLISQLDISYSYDSAVYAAKHCGGDWMEEAVEHANEALREYALSEEALKNHLEQASFSNEEIAYGLNNCSADWNEEAVQAAKETLEYYIYSQPRLVNALKEAYFTAEQAKYGADHCDVDWYEQAVRAAESMLTYWTYSREELVNDLITEQFTIEQAQYGADNCSADWFAQAVSAAAKYFDYDFYTPEEIIEQLEEDGFTHEQAVYGVKQHNNH